MLPRYHILLGALFTGILWITAQPISKFYLLLIFLSSFLVDFDHYVCAVIKSGKFGLFDSFEYHKKTGEKMLSDHGKGLRKKYDFHLFHTLEFHLLIALLGILWTPFFFIFIGMFFHSMLDVIDGLYRGVLYRREFFFFNWLRKII